MQILLSLITDKIQVITDSTATVDVVAAYVDMSQANPPVIQGTTSGPQTTAINSAATTDVVGVPGSSITRNVKGLTIRNKHATTSVNVTVQLNRNGTLYELHKVTLLAGNMLEYSDGTGFFTVAQVPKLDTKLRVNADVTFATAATFADVTGLTTPVFSGKQYCFDARLFHISNATTTGAQFGINGPTMTGMRISALDVILGSLTAATMGSPVTDVTTRDVASIAETTGAATVVMEILTGWFNPSADGTFAVRATSEVTVASGLIVKQGSWCRVWESDN